jgi:cellular nucleic acid-binding protein
MHTTCELCNRTMPTKDWNSHKNSKKHREAEAKDKAAAEGNNTTSFGGDATGFIADTGGFGAGNDTFGTASNGNDAWGSSGNDADWGSGGFDTNANTSTYGNNASGGGDRACFGCGQTGHQKRECPQGSGGGDRSCYGCGQTGHQKRDCPNGGGGGGDQACFNCGEVGFVFLHSARRNITDYIQDIARPSVLSPASPWVVAVEVLIVSASTATCPGKSSPCFTVRR